MKISRKSDFYNYIIKLIIWGRLILRLIFPFFLGAILFILSSSKPNSNILLPPKTHDTIFVYDTVYLYDTIYTNTYEFDTLKSLKIFLKNNPKIIHDSILGISRNSLIYKEINDSKISAEFLFSPVYSKQVFKKDFIYSDFVLRNNDALSPLIGFTSGVNFSYDNKNILFTSGLNFTVVRSKFNYLSSIYTIDSIEYMHYTQIENIRIDSIYFINIDTLLATGDTVYEIYQDTNYFYTLDSTLLKKNDTIETKITDQAINRYIYLEVPFIIGRSYYFENFSLMPEVGLITGIIINSQGKVISLNNINTTMPLNPGNYFSFINISAYGGLKMEYYLTKRLNFIFKTYYRQSINSIFGNYPIVSQNRIFGIQIGVRYKF